MSKLLDVTGLAHRYGRSRRTIYRWLREGKLLEPTLVIPGFKRIRYWSEDAVKAWESSGMVKGRT